METILFDPRFIPMGITNNSLNTFSVCKLICLKPVPSPLPLCGFQPCCTGSAALEYGGMPRWVTSQQLGSGHSFKPKRIGGVKSDLLLQVDSDTSSSLPPNVHLSSLYTHFRARLFVWLAFCLSKVFRQVLNTIMFLWMFFIIFFIVEKIQLVV